MAITWLLRGFQVTHLYDSCKPLINSGLQDAYFG